MSVTSALGNQAKLLWQFLGFFQKPYLRFLHAIIAVLVILQILSSFAMHMLSSGQINPALSSWLASWYHILSGLLVVILSLLLAADSLTKRGFHYFFPYLWGDTEQLKKDIQASLRFKMVPPRPKGLATAVQGLGLGALLLVVLSGLIWFILWRNGSSFAGLALETHKNVTLLIELYLIGHGCMALLHFFVCSATRRARSDQSCSCPYRLSLVCRVLREMPSRFAASLLLSPTLSSIRRMASRSTSSSVAPSKGTDSADGSASSSCSYACVTASGNSRSET